MFIYVTTSRDFDDYNFFVWGMTAVLEDFKQHRQLEIGAGLGARAYAQEWVNKIQPSMRTYGYNIYYRYVDNYKPTLTDYTVHFTTAGRGERHTANKVFVR